MTPIQRILGLLKPERKDILSIYLYALISGVIGLTLPIGIQVILNLIVGGTVSNSWIIMVVAVTIGIALVGIIQVIQKQIAENIQQRIIFRSAMEFAYRIPKFCSDAMYHQHPPEIVNRYFDVFNVTKGLPKLLIDFGTAFFQIVLGLILLSLYHPFFIPFSIGLVLLFTLLFRYTMPVGLTASLKESKYKYKLVFWLEELARAIPTFKLFGTSPLNMSISDFHLSHYLTARKEHFRILIFQASSLIVLRVIIASSLLFLGGFLVMNEQMSIGQFVAAEIIILMVMSAAEKIVLSLETIYDVFTGLEKVGNVTDIVLEDRHFRDPDATVKFKPFSLDIQQLSLSFSNYQQVFSNLQLSIRDQEKVFIYGNSGSGKSALARLIAGFYQNYQGQIYVCKKPMLSQNIGLYREMVGAVFPGEDLFEGTLWDNITMGKPCDEAFLNHLIETFGLQEYIQRMPKELHTRYSGQYYDLPDSIRYKLLLVRQLVHRPVMLVIDSPSKLFNKVDYQHLLNHCLDPAHELTVVIFESDPVVPEGFSSVYRLDHGRLTTV